MENLNSDQYKLERARKRVKAISGFYRHLVVYLLVNGFLIALKYFRLDPDEKFLSFETFATAFFWGIGLAFHALGVFSNNVLFGREWEDRKVRELMEKEKSNTGNSVRTIIIEDEKPAARLLGRKLEKLGVHADVMLHSVAEATQWFRNNQHPELIFLDIQLSDGLSFEIFENVDIRSAVIFTTAYDEYALKAFKLNSIDYLLKPIDEDDLALAINKYRQRNAAASSQFNMADIRKMFAVDQKQEYRERFTIKIGQSLKVISIDEVECFFSENKGTYIHTLDNRDYLIDATMESLESEIDPKRFFRVSRKFILPLKSVREIQVHSNSRLKILLPSYKADEVIVSREKVADFKNWLG